MKLLKNKITEEIKDYQLERWESKENWDEVDNYEFQDTLEFVQFEGYNSMNFRMKSVTDSKEYHMFLSEGERIFNLKKWIGNSVTGRWTFRKQGKAYSIKYLVK